MKRIGSALGVFALLLGLGVLLGDTQAQEQKTPSIKQIMKTAHGKSADSQLNKAKAALKAGDFKALDTAAEELVKSGKALAENTPKKGNKESWDEQTKKYLDNAKALEKAAHKEDKAAAETALKGFTASCSGCHKGHK